MPLKKAMGGETLGTLGIVTGLFVFLDFQHISSLLGWERVTSASRNSKGSIGHFGPF